MLEAILSAAGYSVGCYTSPHLLRYNERVRINRQEVTDAALCRAFAAVEAARGAISLTYFEFGTLAALWLFSRQGVGAAVLEVGLGGRLDAVNAFDPDCSVVTSIALDHMDYLGHTREAIGFEKAGIFRKGRPAICADPLPPASLTDYALQIGADLQCIDRDFGFVAEAGQWRFHGRRGDRYALPYPALSGAFQLSNAAACLAALDEMQVCLPVAMNDIRRGLLEVSVPGRFQVLPGAPRVILDVAHNPHAAAALAENLRSMAGGKTIAVFSMLADKDITGVVQAMKACVDSWLVAAILEQRGASLPQIMDVLNSEGLLDRVSGFACVAEAYRYACNVALEDDKIIVFGSFYTVAGVLRQRTITDEQSEN